LLKPDRIDMQFDALQLLPGTAMKLSVLGPDRRRHAVQAQYIGCRAPRVILVTVPTRAVGLVLRVGSKVGVSALTPTGIVSFVSAVEVLNSQPFVYAHLLYPAAVQVRSVRAAARVNVELGAGVTNLEDLDHLESLPARVLDISVRGLKLGADVELGRVGDELSIHVQLAFDDISRDLSLNGKIRSRRLADSLSGPFAHVFGVEFTALDEDKRVLLHAYVLNMLRRNGAQI
jgi:hypothetical protein